VFAMLGTLMFCSKLVMQVLPNIHLVGMLVMVYTVVFRAKALIPIYLYILLEGIFGGFSPWWVPYLYVWTVLWGITMLLPRHMPKPVAAIVYPAVCCLHGLSFGILYAPAQALMYGLDLRGMLTWIAMGFSFDVTHAISNLCMGVLILPLSQLLKKLCRQTNI